MVTPIRMVLLVGLFGCAARRPPPPLSDSPTTLTVSYTDEVPPEARAVLDEAARRWAAAVVSPVPIRVRVDWIFGNGPQGFCWPNLVRNFEGAPTQDVYYPSALADALAGRDLQPGADDMNVFFKDKPELWHFDWTTPVPAGRTDFLTVAMHELGHGLGISTLTFVPWDGPPTASIGQPNEVTDFFAWSFSVPELDGTPSIYDAMVHTWDGRPIVDFPNPSAELHAALVGPLTFHGPAAMGLHGGPVPIDSGSVSHLSRSILTEAHADWQMAPQTGEGVAQHDPGPLTRAVLADLGWRVR